MRRDPALARQYQQWLSGAITAFYGSVDRYGVKAKLIATARVSRETLWRILNAKDVPEVETVLRLVAALQATPPDFDSRLAGAMVPAGDQRGAIAAKLRVAIARLGEVADLMEGGGRPGQSGPGQQPPDPGQASGGT